IRVPAAAKRWPLMAALSPKRFSRYRHKRFSADGLHRFSRGPENQRLTPSTVSSLSVKTGRGEAVSTNEMTRERAAFAGHCVCARAGSLRVFGFGGLFGNFGCDRGRRGGAGLDFCLTFLEELNEGGVAAVA